MNAFDFIVFLPSHLYGTSLSPSEWQVPRRRHDPDQAQPFYPKAPWHVGLDKFTRCLFFNLFGRPPHNCSKRRPGKRRALAPYVPAVRFSGRPMSLDDVPLGTDVVAVLAFS